MILFVAAILIVGGLLYAVVSFTRHAGDRALNTDKYRSKWLQIQKLLEQGDHGRQMAILQADKLLDQALRERNFRGETMGERMKSASKSWSNAGAVWSAHKLRNQIAHETEVNLSSSMANQALASFKQALKDVGAI